MGAQGHPKTVFSEDPLRNSLPQLQFHLTLILYASSFMLTQWTHSLVVRPIRIPEGSSSQTCHCCDVLRTLKWVTMTQNVLCGDVIHFQVQRPIWRLLPRSCYQVVGGPQCPGKRLATSQCVMQIGNHYFKASSDINFSSAKATATAWPFPQCLVTLPEITSQKPKSQLLPKQVSSLLEIGSLLA